MINLTLKLSNSHRIDDCQIKGKFHQNIIDAVLVHEIRTYLDLSWQEGIQNLLEAVTVLENFLSKGRSEVR